MAEISVSIVVVVKDAAAILPGALDSLRAQSFKDFDVVAIDGESTDNTLEILKQASEDLTIDITSEADRSLSEGLSKGLSRAKGDIVGILCADERYRPDTLEKVVEFYRGAPNTVALAGREEFIDAGGEVVGDFFAGPFDLEEHLSCETVWPISATFFNRRFIAPHLWYDPDIPTCPDYELWGRLGLIFRKELFTRLDYPLVRAYQDETSMSFRPQAFERMVADKLAHLENLLVGFIPDGDRDRLRRKAAAGINLWASEQIKAMGSDPDLSLDYCRKAASYNAGCDRIAAFCKRIGVTYDRETGVVGDLPQSAPGPKAFKPEGLWVETVVHSPSQGQILPGQGQTLRTDPGNWSYSFDLCLEGQAGALAKARAHQIWLELDLEVSDGAVGVGALVESAIVNETVITPSDGRKLLLLPLSRTGEPAAVVRSGGRGGSVIRIHSAVPLVDPVG